jgi:hypothetical protein
VRRALGLVLLIVLAAVLAACGSSDKSKRRNEVNSYLNKVQDIQNRFSASFLVANQAYRDFAKGKGGKHQLQKLRGAEVSIIGARDALQQLIPPPDARKLHRQLLRLYDLDAALGLEAITLQQFLPAVRGVLKDLARVNTSYRKNLASTSTAGEQATALDSYAGAVNGVVKEFDKLGPPQALRPWQTSQQTRLRQIVSTGHLLATALRVGDRNAVQGLIKRFRFLLSHQPNVSQAQHDAVKAYDNRLVGITRLQGKIQSEHQRLQNLLG